MDKKYENCIVCGKCTRICRFLNKHSINLKDYAQKTELAYNCFLCGECKRVCPVDIDGRQISLDLRKKCISGGYKPDKNGYGNLLFEKRNYLFKNYRHIHSKTILFPGCNFPAYYPKTTNMLLDLFLRNGIGFAFDCCGKPVGELGLSGDENRIFRQLNDNLQKSGVEEIITVCPNCYYYLEGKLSVRITNIYTKLIELGEVHSISISDGLLYLPCPDRDSKYLLKGASNLLTGEVNIASNMQCCGAGGCASVKEPSIANELKKEFLNLVPAKIYTYCATCAGLIAKKGTQTEHILCKLLNSGEKPAQGAKSLINRALLKIK